MQRFLICVSPLLLLLLAGCLHEAFHTSIENGTGQKIYVVIHFNDGKMPQGHGYVEPGNGVDFPQKAEKINYIEYQIGGRNCRIERQSIIAMAHVQSQGISRITLQDCGK